MTTRPTPPMPARGRYTMARLRPMGTCGAPTHAAALDTLGRLHHEARPARCGTCPNDDRAADCLGCLAPAPAACEGTEWPAATSWARYAQDRAAGSRVPPSVSVWRPEDARRQAAADREARGQALTVARTVAWMPGSACEDRKAVG